MKQTDKRESNPQTAAEHGFHSVRAVIARMAEVLWQADAAGNVTGITLCRPALPEGEGTLDETEVSQIEQLWRKCVRCAEPFSAIYHVRSPGCSPRTFLVQAVPVLDHRDDVRYWSGNAAEVDRFADAGTRFISEAAVVLSSTLNRGTIVNRLLQTSVDHFSDICAIHAFDRKGAVLEGIADRRGRRDVQPGLLEEAAVEVRRTRQPLLLVPGAAGARSTIVAPLLAGATCIGTLSFLESERAASFGARDVDVAVVVARQLTMALENIKTFEREQQATERFRFLARATEPLFSTLDSTKMLQLLLDSLVNEFADYAITASLNNTRLRILAASGTKVLAFRDTSVREMVTALHDRRSILVGAEHNLRRGLNNGPLAGTERPRSWMMAPLFSGDSVYGALICCSNTRYYDLGDLELLQEVGRRASLALERAASFERERRLAHTLQQATLPTRLASVEGASLSAVYRPASAEMQVGGDWYDSFELAEGRVLLTVGDVTGHGLQASIVMGKLRHAINIVALYEPNPVRILDAAERILVRRYPGSVATAFVAIIDSRKGTIAYANAGHPYPISGREDGTLEELEAEGLPIGLRSFAPTAAPITKRLDDARLLAFYTDGLTEASRDMLAGEKLLHRALTTQAIAYVESPARFVESFCLQGQSFDDVAILVLNFVQAQRWTFESKNWRAARLARREFVASVEPRAARDSDLKSAELIFGELAANVAQHAAGPIEMALDWQAGHAVLHVIDRGNGYAGCDPTEADLLNEHGRGLWLVKRLGARLGFEALPGFGTHVYAVLPIRERTD
jgi:serine phosphatase RsbU (regulator of sigma subunit)/anti-sigma regulatory factor (Ser/Thr protein kinase)